MLCRIFNKRSLVLASVIAFLAGCDLNEPGASAIPGWPDLEQVVRVTPKEPTSGDTLRIVSVVTNRGSDAVRITARVCGVTLGGDLQLEWPPGIVTCAGYSSTGALGPGDSSVESTVRLVASPAGVYQLTVQHLLEPDFLVSMQVRVRALMRVLAVRTNRR